MLTQLVTSQEKSLWLTNNRRPTYKQQAYIEGGRRTVALIPYNLENAKSKERVRENQSRVKQKFLFFSTGAVFIFLLFTK
jgi:hypothetical protein